MTTGASYAGHEADPAYDARNFEFVTPVELFGERYALELSYDHRAFDAQLTRVRRVLGLAGMLALALGAGLFYLLGVMRSHRSALQRATRDGLTDLPNHRAFGDDFGRAVANAEQYQEPLALAVVDLDDFKFLNDRHGHPQGDTILRRIAAILLDGRVDDRAYRIGGDEFALILTHADAEGATVLASRLLRKAHEAGSK